MRKKSGFLRRLTWTLSFSLSLGLLFVDIAQSDNKTVQTGLPDHPPKPVVPLPAKPDPKPTPKPDPKPDPRALRIPAN